ncbi:Heat shock 70 kDa protein 12A [Entomortierella chlamydospora]|uniref:Heat shock 70 kDa protein 12A n=1 Tax=Entomortierella chlamydospora TaxID=101097 RepID=A0A9P6N0N5_9FUNG|nr:Heat shock 70 kDa protein 12A [Entomortierella chlamydospora]
MTLPDFDPEDYPIVVAIDFGTTFSPKQNVQYAKTPTLNLYKKVNGEYKMVEWGWKSKLPMETPAASKYIQLYQYKPHLDEGLDMKPWSNKVSVPDAISDYLRALHEYVADKILQEFGRSYSRKSFRYCLTVPAMWSDKAKDVMRKAAIRAGLIKAADHPDRLMLVSEPEAAALYCEKACKQYDLGHGDQFMICDAGGGTVDLIVYEISSTSQGRRLSEVTKGHGASCGSMFIDLNLGNLLIKKFKKQGAVFPKSVIQTMVESFAYQLKPQFDGDEDLYLALPRSDCFDDIRDPQRIGIDGGYMCLKASELKKAVFDPVVKQVLELIGEQLNSAKKCSAIFMVGGFGSSTYLLDRVKEDFDGWVRTVSAPYKPEMAVVCGAVYAGLNPKIVTARVTRRCYGFGVMAKFEEGLDPIALRRERIDGAWCANRFATDGYPPRYTTDAGVSKLARITFPTPFKSCDPLGHMVDVEMKIYFGLNEIKAEAIIQGKKYSTTLRFMQRTFPLLRKMTSTTSSKTIKIDIVSDIACPWCYVGKRRMEKAINSFKSKPENEDVQFEVNWLPYQLDPAASKTPIPKMTLYAQKFGATRAPLMRDRMIQVGQEEGIKFSYNGNTINTLDSHRLIDFATKRGKQDEIVTELFENYFEQDKCGEISTLVDSAAKVGLDRAEVEAYLKSNEGTKEVQDGIEKAKLQGIQGVPNFTIDGKYVLSGAQEPSTFEEIFNKVI